LADHFLFFLIFELHYWYLGIHHWPHSRPFGKSLLINGVSGSISRRSIQAWTKNDLVVIETMIAGQAQLEEFGKCYVIYECV
jgi:hypothetical protein